MSRDRANEEQQKHIDAVYAGVTARVDALLAYLRAELMGRDAERLYRYAVRPHESHLRGRNVNWRLTISEPDGVPRLEYTIAGETGVIESHAFARGTIGEALKLIETNREELEVTVATQILDLLPLVPPRFQAATVARESLYQGWPLFNEAEANDPPVLPLMSTLEALRALVPLRAGELPSSGAGIDDIWPAQVAINDVLDWVSKTPTSNATVKRFSEEDEIYAFGHLAMRPDFPAIGALYAAYQAVDRDRRRPVIRHAATKAGRAALSVLAAGAGSHNTAHPWRVEDFTLAGGTAELVWDGRRTPVQLRLELDDARLDYLAVRGILEELHEDGLRDWLVLHRMAGEQGSTGLLSWTWDDHKAHTPYARRVNLGKQTDAVLAEETMRRLWQLKRAEIRLYHPHLLANGSRPWVRVGPGGLIDIPAGIKAPAGRDELVVIKINPEIYEGARRKTEAPHFMLLGENAVGLPGGALRLLSLLACDWQYARKAEGITREASTLWGYAAIRDGRRTPRKRWPEAERTLERLLDELGAHNHLKAWQRGGGEGAAREYHLEPPQWWTDQVILDVPPDFGTSRAGLPKTGAELRQWRERRGWSLDTAAGWAHVGRSTIQRAEAAPTKPLSPRLLRALQLEPPAGEDTGE